MPDVSAPNVFRDVDFVVVPLQGAEFPCRCVKTNTAVLAADYLLKTDRRLSQSPGGTEITSYFAAKAIAGSVGPIVVDMLTKDILAFQIGLSKEYQVKSRFRKTWGLVLLLGQPLIALILGVIVSATAEHLGFDPQQVRAFIMGLVIATVFICTVAGSVLFAMSTAGVLRVHMIHEGYVWLAGACPDFLSELPQCPKRKPGPLIDISKLFKRMVEK